MKNLAIIFVGLIRFSLGNDISSDEYTFYDYDSSEYSFEEIEERVANGTEMPMATLSEFKYQVGLYILHPEDKLEICGGAIIHPEIILSAAHCFQNYLYVGIFIGTVVRPKTINSTDFIVYPKDITVHKNYTVYSDKLLNDIALIKLPIPVPLSEYVGVIQLAPKDFDCESGEGWVSGWGHTNDTHISPDIMNFVKTNSTECIFDQVEKCRICSSGMDSKNACAGDSGGSFAFENGNGGRYSCGINSYMFQSWCENKLPRVHTSVQYYYNNRWICENSGELVGCDI